MPTQEEVVTALGNMSVTQLIELTHRLEDLWGIRANPIPVPAIGFAPVPPAPVGTDPLAEDDLAVVLVAVGEHKVHVIKVIREVLGLPLLEAKKIVEGLPQVIKAGLSRADAEDISKKFEAEGAKVEVR